MLPLHLACWCNQAELIQFLVEDVSKESINEVVAASGNSPLHYTTWKNHVEACRYLLDMGADFSAPNNVC